MDGDDVTLVCVGDAFGAGDFPPPLHAAKARARVVTPANAAHVLRMP
ncbi:MAG TPA: hypothetical protein VFX33_02785 [Actinomycetales bacterium]|nr:hypothetical protein [Actinomycetales bacterium]